MLKSKLSRRVAKKRRAATPAVQSLEALEPKVLLSATSTAHVDSQMGPSTRIVNGSETNDYEAVGIVNNGCTGTLISPTHVLTAAHCTEGVGDRSGTFEVGGEVYRTTDIIDHPDYNPNQFDVGYDISIMELARPVTGIEPMEIFRDTPEVGQLLTLVGFGEGGTSTGGSTGDFGTKRVGETEIDEVTNLHVSWNFDSHQESNTAPGDSGGPAFVTVGNNLFIAGVTSGGTGDAHELGDFSFDTRVDTFASWIDSIVGDDGGGGEDPPPPPPPPGDRHEFEQNQGKTIRDDRVHTVTSALNVSGLKGNITDLNVELDIQHSWTSDLRVQLIAPDGTKINLFREVGEDGQDFDGTWLDDEADTSISDASAPFRGVFRPEGNLSKFDGLDPNGRWRLKIRDTYEEDGGRLNSWKLSFEVDGDDDGGGGGGGSDSGSFTNSDRVEIASDRANTIKSKLTVDGLDGNISDINVKLNIDHTWNDDLMATLISPSGTKVQLFRWAGEDGDGFINTTLDDSASESIQNGEAPFTGAFKPRRQLSKFNDEDPNGVWTLVIRDRFAEDGGSLNNWTLEVETDGSSGGRSKTNSMTPREKKRAHFTAVRHAMRRGVQQSPQHTLRGQLHKGSVTKAEAERTEVAIADSYREAKLNSLKDSVFSMVNFERLFDSL